MSDESPENDDLDFEFDLPILSESEESKIYGIFGEELEEQAPETVENLLNIRVARNCATCAYFVHASSYKARAGYCRLSGLTKKGAIMSKKYVDINKLIKVDMGNTCKFHKYGQTQLKKVAVWTGSKFNHDGSKAT